MANYSPRVIIKVLISTYNLCLKFNQNKSSAQAELTLKTLLLLLQMLQDLRACRDDLCLLPLF